jgi:hypothetical protein
MKIDLTRFFYSATEANLIKETPPLKTEVAASALPMITVVQEDILHGTPLKRDAGPAVEVEFFGARFLYKMPFTERRLLKDDDAIDDIIKIYLQIASFYTILNPHNREYPEGDPLVWMWRALFKSPFGKHTVPVAVKDSIADMYTEHPLLVGSDRRPLTKYERHIVLIRTFGGYNRHMLEGRRYYPVARSPVSAAPAHYTDCIKGWAAEFNRIDRLAINHIQNYKDFYDFLWASMLGKHRYRAIDNAYAICTVLSLQVLLELTNLAMTFSKTSKSEARSVLKAHSTFDATLHVPFMVNRRYSLRLLIKQLDDIVSSGEGRQPAPARKTVDEAIKRALKAKQRRVNY